MGRLLFYCVIFLSLVATSAARAGAWEDILRAAEASDVDTVAGLLTRGMDPNTSDQSGTTLLMIAARNGSEPLLELLLRNRANALKKNKYGDSAISLAAIGGRLQVVKRLVDYGVPIGGDGWSPLEYASFAGQAEIVSYLLSRGAPVDARAPNGQTSLMLAAAGGHTEILRLLIAAGAELTLADMDGHTALDIAVSGGKDGAAELLRQAQGAKK